MTLELDHIFVCTGPGAPDAEKLAALGLTEGTGNVHPGQGTACRRFFFRNAMLELLWLRDEQEARSPDIAPLKLPERCGYLRTGYSPFGVCLRPDPAHTTSAPDLPSKTWEYRPPYLPAGVHIDVAADTFIGEPLLFAMPFGGRPDSYSGERRQPLQHSAGLDEITGLRLTLPQEEAVSAPFRALEARGLVSLSAGAGHLMEIEFDSGVSGRSADLRPALPLRLRW